jgi:DNA polymerase-1
MGVIPLLLKMRKTGVRIDRAKLTTNINYIQDQIKVRERNLFSKYGTFNYKSFPQTKEVFKNLGLDTPLNIDGKESFDKDSLKSVDHEISKEILACREMKTALQFLINSFYDNLVGDKIHCSFNPLRSDEYGTVSGRLSGSNPNLQQVKHVDNDEEKSEDFEHELGVLARDIFVPTLGYDWGKLDYSQIEYRFIAHYADGERASEVRKEYNEKPETDYHQMIMDWTGLARSDAKRLNFGVAYSMGASKMAYKFGWSIERAKELVTKYHDNVPFVKYTSRQVMQKAVIRDKQTNGHGYIKTILGRRARISESMRKEKREYSLFNRLIQGSAADMMKKAMYDAWLAGVFDTLPPHLTVHDELDVSVPQNEQGKEAVKELKYIMENAITLKVPVIAELEIGPSWARLKKVKEEK